jgi:hypothetical protein
MTLPLAGLAPTDPMTKVELERVIRVCRAARDEIVVRKFQLQERELTHGDGHVKEAILTCENEAYLLTTAIAKMWVQLHK